MSKLNASTGALQGTFAAGTSSATRAYAGTNMWVVNTNNNNVLLNTILAGTSPRGIAFDGANFCVPPQNRFFN